MYSVSLRNVTEHKGKFSPQHLMDQLTESRKLQNRIAEPKPTSFSADTFLLDAALMTRTKRNAA